MAANKLINLIAISSLAILACTFAPAQVNALSTGYHHVNHHVAHEGIAKRSKRKRQQSQRCKQRPSSSSAAPTSTSWTPPPSPTTTWVPTTSAAPPAPAPPPPPSSSWSPIPSPSPSSSGGSGSGKVGIAWNNGDESWLANFKTPATRFVYTWSEYKPSNADSLGFEFWPMLWGPSHVDSFNQLVVAGYGTTILGFNEPEISGQSNIDPQTAASLWQQNIQPKKQLGYNLISPAVTSDAAGIPWLQQFFQACQGCTFDGVAMHWYGTDPNAFMSYVENFHTTFNLPVHITEFADQNFSGSGGQADMDDIWNFYGTINPWLDSQPYVASYFQFGALTNLDGVNSLNGLMNQDGTPTSLGWMYISDNYNN
ncbi:hypothetical protein AcW1_004498 [Taiwanofungus camphoratus]|nr:hypothetical protein AcV5_000880 [Antrodia cinnamomea]KAI0952390.1 hypothetical protein AcV7_008213 [Antrodia cinnamomea]KAI0959769.1 hypothetical protein AcW1_004498 [Antrodia cinnamomea]